MRRAGVGVRVDIREEHGVDEGGLAQARLAHHHQRKFEPAFDGLAVHLIGQVGKADIAVQLTSRRPRRRRPWLGRHISRLGS